MSQPPDFLSIYRMVTVGVGLLSPAILSVMWNGDAGFRVWIGNPMDLTPYGLLLAITRMVRHPLPLASALVTTFLFGVYCVVAMKEGGSSTAALGFYAIPFYQVVVVIPGTLLLTGIALAIWRILKCGRWSAT